MKRLALALALTLAAPAARAADPPPPWMPAPPPRPTRSDEARVRKLKRETTAFGLIGLVLFAGGIAVNVVALDLPQAERASREPDGSVVIERYRGDANWAEFAGGVALMGAGFALLSIAYVKLQQMRKLQATQ